MRRAAVVTAIVGLSAAGALAAGAVGYALVIAQPGPQHLALPAGAIALSSSAGAALLVDAHAADHAPLMGSLQAQERAAWCGVASAVTVLNAAYDRDLRQSDLFTDTARRVRSSWRVTLGGMPLSVLEGLVEAHDVSAVAHFAADEDLHAFTSELARNLSAPGDFIVVNYDRRILGQQGAGHISPVSALSADHSQVLVLDTAAYKYAPHWVPTEALHRAMDTPDSESGRSRGWLVVGAPAPQSPRDEPAPQ